MSQETVACNVVILPAPTLAALAIEWSATLAQHGSPFTLAEGAFYPHASVYMLQLRAGDLPEVEGILSDIANSTEPLHLQAEDYSQARQFLSVGYAKTSQMQLLQDNVVEALNSVRDGMRAEDYERMQEATGMRLENYKRYGWDSVGELYHPHLTLTRFRADHGLASLALPNVDEFTGGFIRLGLFEMGDNGTCVREIKTFGLGKA